SNDLVENSRAWLDSGISREFTPAQDMRILLAMLAQERLTEPQFWSLARDRAVQMNSHIAATRSLANRKVRSVIVGIDRYDASGLPKLRYAVNDAKMVRDSLSSAVPKPSDGEVSFLIDQEATEAQVRKAIRSQAAPARECDLLLLYFGGMGWRSDLDDIKTES